MEGAEPKRARSSNGQLKGDDPSTDVNEAYEQPKKKEQKKLILLPSSFISTLSQQDLDLLRGIVRKVHLASVEQKDSQLISNAIC